MPLTFTPNLGQTEPRLRFTLRGVGYAPLFSISKAAVEQSGKANYSIANTPPPWLVNVPRSVNYRTVHTRNLQYYGQRVPLVGKTILRIAQQADSHPRIARALGIIRPKF